MYIYIYTYIHMGTQNFQCFSGDFLSIQRSADLSRALSIKSLHTILLPNKQIHENPLTRSTRPRAYITLSQGAPSRYRIGTKPRTKGTCAPQERVISFKTGGRNNLDHYTPRRDFRGEPYRAPENAHTPLPCLPDTIRDPSQAHGRDFEMETLRRNLLPRLLSREFDSLVFVLKKDTDCSRISLKRPARPCNFFLIEGMYLFFIIRERNDRPPKQHASPSSSHECISADA